MAAAAEGPVSLCISAEQALLLSDFSGAEACARRCLASTESAAVRERALVVALQALYETQRMGAAHALLRECCDRLEDVPPNALLVWLSLAVDSVQADEAKRLIQSLLASRQPGGASGWTRQQYLALLHLHVFHVLLPERGLAEAARWVEGTQLPLAATERQLLLDELTEQQQLLSAAAAASSAAPAAVRNAAQAAADGGQGRARHAQQPAPALQPEQQHAQPTSTGTRAAAAPDAGVPAAQQRRMQQRQQQGEPEIVPAPEEAAAAAAAAGSAPVPALAAGISWLCQAQQQALQAAGAWLRPLLGNPAAEQQGTAAELGSDHSGLSSSGAVPTTAQPSPDPLPLLGGTVLGAVLLYALYAERQSLRRGARRARRAVTGGMADLLRMAFSLSINPLTSTRTWG